MKTRIIQTKFWVDPYIQNLSTNEKLLFLFLISNERIEKTGAYEISLRDINYFTGVSTKEIEKALEKFTNDRKIIYIREYVICINAKKYQDYSKGSKNQIENYLKEFSKLPDYVQNILENNGNVDNLESNNKSGDIQLVGNQLATSCQLDIKHKDKNINNKIKIINKKEIENEKKLKNIVDFYNEVFGKSVESTAGFKNNFQYWIEIHPEEKIGKAIANAKMDKFWADKFTLDILFRKKNPRGENVDRIEELANRNVEQMQGNIAFN